MRTFELWTRANPTARPVCVSPVFLIKNEGGEVTFEAERRVAVAAEAQFFLRMTSSMSEEVVHELDSFVSLALMPPLLYSARMGRRVSAADGIDLAQGAPG